MACLPRKSVFKNSLNNVMENHLSDREKFITHNSIFFWQFLDLCLITYLFRSFRWHWHVTSWNHHSSNYTIHTSWQWSCNSLFDWNIGLDLHLYHRYSHWQGHKLFVLSHNVHCFGTWSIGDAHKAIRYWPSLLSQDGRILAKLIFLLSRSIFLTTENIRLSLRK